jgi:hypothetical protein
VEVEGVADDGIQREVLPMPDQPWAGLTTYDASDPDSNRRHQARGPTRPLPATTAATGAGLTSKQCAHTRCRRLSALLDSLRR